MAEKEIGVVTHYFDRIEVGAIRLTDEGLRTGETIHILGHATDLRQTVGSMQIKHEVVTEAKRCVRQPKT